MQRERNQALPHPVIETVRRTLAQHRMVSKGETVLVAFSGGADSTALLHILSALGAPMGFHVAAAHLHHGLRGAEADRDADFAVEQARRLGLDCFIDRVDIEGVRRQEGLSWEEAARHARYHFLERLAERRGFQRIALGHHRDDNAEMLLMRIIRGSGISGVSGIPPIRERRIIRPLFFLTRADIESYLRAANLSFVVDASNFDNRFLRNRVRNELIPHLAAAYNPAICSALNRLSDIAREEDAWMETEARHALERIARRTGASSVELDRERFNALAKAIRRRVARHGVAAAGGALRRLAWIHVEDILTLCDSPRDGLCIDLPDGIEVRIGDGRLSFEKRGRGFVSRTAAPTFSYEVPMPDEGGLRIDIREVGVGVRFFQVPVPDTAELAAAGPHVAFFDAGRLQFPMRLRNVQPGDRFHPLGAAGSQKVRKFFIDRKVPRSARADCPILVSGGTVAWVVGHRIAEDMKITPATQTAIKGEVLLA